ncbi:MAG: c-type cytochrome [Agriterribacter sp.]
MRIKFYMHALAMGCIVAAVVACSTKTTPAEIVTEPNKDSLIKRGAYLVAVMGCDDCHSPKRMGAHGPEIIPELRLSGFQQNASLPPVDTNQVKKGWVLFSPDLTGAVGPWGATFAGNITGDSTGIGTWSEAQFKKALREGKFKGLDNTRPLLPPMPWQNLAQLSDIDMKAVYTFLQSTHPVRNVVPAPKPFSALH